MTQLRARGLRDSSRPRRIPQTGTALLTNPLLRKGGAPLLGARRPGEHGPFGRYPDDDASSPGGNDVSLADASGPQRPVLTCWLAPVGDRHPVRRWQERAHTEPLASSALDALENLLATAEPGDPQGWRKKQTRDFPALNTHSQLLDLRSELVVARALGLGGIDYRLGDTRVSNPDFLLASGVGIEVTARAPQGIDALCTALDGLLERRPGTGTSVVFDLYPSRLRDEVVTDVLRAVDDVLAAGPEHGQEPVRVRVQDPKNVVEVVVEVRVTPGRPGVRWEVTAGDLAPGLGSAEYAVFDVANSEAKAAQGLAVQGPSVLMVDVSRYGAAWMRPGHVWAPMLAQRFPQVFPFGAVGVFHQSLEHPFLLDAGVAISSQISETQQGQVRALCESLGWPYAVSPGPEAP